ncbi:GGDEF domain-containing protein [Aneurinibacillus tyrosinisolvens]|uniref:GGDEF domain-containing protein n=1 Tax=Aneurinibacillus tyrosinisolvens TaxID=1443435 RepID=UPI000A6201BE|nr:diguanylate cyclase [Aneurinibacillus tyrosinisolvens]
MKRVNARQSSIEQYKPKGMKEFLQAKERQDQFRCLVESSPETIAVYDNGTTAFINPAGAKLLGAASPEEIIGKHIQESLHPGSTEFIEYCMEAIHKSERKARLFEQKMIRVDGTIINVEISAVPISYDRKLMIQAVIRDISERKEMERRLRELNEQLQHLSSVDGLTGVANRRSFEELFDKEWKRAVRSTLPLSLCMIDVDFFKAYNDTYGHVNGDECLKQVAGALAGVLKRPADSIARYGGEEFAIILPETNRKGALMLAEQLRAAVEALHIPHAQSKAGRHVTISAGVATLLPGAAGMREDILKAADSALYKAKQQGRNRVCSSHSSHTRYVVHKKYKVCML